MHHGYHQLVYHYYLVMGQTTKFKVAERAMEKVMVRVPLRDQIRNEEIQVEIVHRIGQLKN